MLRQLESFGSPAGAVSPVDGGTRRPFLAMLTWRIWLRRTSTTLALPQCENYGSWTIPAPSKKSWENVNVLKAQKDLAAGVSGARATPILIPCIHINLSFPTPIIISFIPPPFLTDSYPFRNALDGRPVPSYCWILPIVTFVVIDHKGDRTISIRRMRMCHQRCGWSPIRIA